MSTDKRLFGGNPNKKALDFLDKLQSSKKSSAEPNQSLESQDIYLGDNSPFARMWTATQINISGSNADPELVFHSINEGREFSYTSGYGNPDLLNYKKQNLNNPYLKPAAGITSITSKSEGALGALRKTVVEFTVHNKKDFEQIFLPFFLRPGAMVCVDFGWNTNIRLPLYNPEDVLKDNPSMENFDKIIKEKVSENFGNLEVCIGNVQKYDTSIDELGSFRCSLEIVSRNWSLLDAEVTDDNNLKFAFTNFLEDIIIKVLNYRATGEESTSPLNKNALDVFSAEDYEKSANTFFDGLQDAGDLGIIDTRAKIMGVYYQDVYDNNIFWDTGQEGEDEAGQESDDDDDALYISYGFFEDVFLNNLVKSVTDVDGNFISSNSLKVGFNSKNSYIRFNQNIFTAQLQKLMKTESALSFVYPDTWERTYNTNGEERSEASDEKEMGIMPFRELFIRTSLIKKAFKQKHNVNDAIEFILDTLNKDSFGIFKLKMGSPKVEIGEGNDKILVTSDTQIGIFDAHQEIELPSFTFDLTGGVGFVKNADIKFQTPKAGMASMIAISNLSDDEVFYRDTELTKLNLLKVLDNDYKGSRVFLKSMPNVGDINKSVFEGSIDFDFSAYQSKIAKDKKDLSNYSDDFKKGLKRYSKSVEKTISDKEDAGETTDDTTTPGSDSSDKVRVIVAKTPRQYHLGLAKLDTMFDSKSPETIAPILPIEMSLTTYGNNCLNMGDVFKINYLPEHYIDRVFFQTTGIEHKLSTAGWETTYDTVMRVAPHAIGSAGVNKKGIRLELTTAYAKTSQGHLFGDVDMMNGVQKSIVNRPFSYGGFAFHGTKTFHVHSTEGVFEEKHVGSDFNAPKSKEDVAALWAFTHTMFDTTEVKEQVIDDVVLHNQSLLAGSDHLENWKDNIYTEPSRDLIDDYGSWLHTIFVNWDFGLSKFEERVVAHLVNKTKMAKNLHSKVNERAEDGLIRPIMKYRFDSTNFNKYNWVSQDLIDFEEIVYYVVSLEGITAENITSIPGFVLPERIFVNNFQSFCQKFSENYHHIIKKMPTQNGR